MIKVINRRKFTRAMCLNCMCEFLYEKEDSKYIKNEILHKDERFIECPDCGQLVRCPECEDEERKVPLYVVRGNTYYDGYGYVENIFGIYTEKEIAEDVKDSVTKELYDKESKRGRLSMVTRITDIDVSVVEVQVNKLVNIELGRYCE